MNNETSKHAPKRVAASESTETRSWKQRLVFAAIVSAAMAFTLCFFGPLDLFFNNYEELWFHLQDIIGSVVKVSLIFFAGATLVGTLLRGRLHSVYMALLFGGLLGTWVQGSFMNKNYGILNGTSVNWSAYTGYGIVNSIVWIICIALPLVLMLVLKEKKMRPVLIFLSCALIVMQGASLTVSYLNYPKVERSTTLSNEGVFDLSKKENTLVYLVDTLDEAYYRDMIKRHPDYKKKLTGFTCYDNAMTSGARTLVAVPMITTGIPRTTPGPYADYIDHIWSKQTLFKDLKSSGYDTRLYTQARFVSSVAQKQIDNMHLSSSIVGNRYGLIKKLYKLTLYKYVPHFFKWRFWLYTSEFDRFQKKNRYQINDAGFYKGFQKHKGFTYSDSGKCFRLYHLRGTHPPYNINVDGTHSKTTTSIPEQADGIFHIIFDMLDNLKRNGVYDKTNIFIIADHGDTGKDQWAACLYKPAGSTGPYRVSQAPISFLDVTATLDRIAGGNVSQVGSGRTIDEIKENEKRTRTLFRISGSNATLNSDEYQSDGHASDPDKLKLVQQYHLQDASSAEPYTLGTELSFVLNKATANIYCTTGFRAPAGGTTSIEGRQAQMVIPIKDPPKEGALTVSLTCRDVIVDCDMVISSNGQEVFRKSLTAGNYKPETFTFDIQVSALKDDKLTLDFFFPTVPKSEDEKQPGQRSKVVRLKEMVIDTAK